MKKKEMPDKGLPRLLEFLLALLALGVLFPFLLLCALAVRCSSPGPVLYRQIRVGRQGKTFVFFKFRSMGVNNQGPGVTARGDERITTVGRFLRKTKLDELPSLWNVVLGDLSLVGPRPEVPGFVDLRNPLWPKVLACRPGLTDPVTMRLRNEEELLSQVEGSREDFYLQVLQPLKLRGYVAYQEGRTFWTDLRTLIKSLWVTLFPGKVEGLNVDDLAEKL
ncbi:MAG: sugar transferase [Thermodesulfobacteriota bacterium]